MRPCLQPCPFRFNTFSILLYLTHTILSTISSFISFTSKLRKDVFFLCFYFPRTRSFKRKITLHCCISLTYWFECYLLFSKKQRVKTPWPTSIYREKNMGRGVTVFFSDTPAKLLHALTITVTSRTKQPPRSSLQSLHSLSLDV